MNHNVSKQKPYLATMLCDTIDLYLSRLERGGFLLTFPPRGTQWPTGPLPCKNDGVI